MTLMRCGLVLAALLLVTPRAGAIQPIGVLHIKVVVENGEQRATPVPRHALLVSDNPASAPPRRIFTSTDGSVDVRLAPGNYTVESDRPLVFEGKAYQWTRMVDILAGGEVVLELTAGNAEVEVLTSATTSTASPLVADPASALTRWQDSVVGIWTPTTHASGTVIGTNGLMVTNQRVVGTATLVEVQITATVKVAGSIVVADPSRDVAVIRIDPTIAASVRPVPLGCGQAPPPLVEGEEIFAIEAPLRREKGTTSGIVSRVGGNAIVSDLRVASGGSGGPVFTASGAVVGIVTVDDESDDPRRGNSRAVRIGDVCHVVAMAEAKMKNAPPPAATHLPVEPVQTFPEAALKDAVGRRTGSLNPYQVSSSDFDIAFMTPVHIYAARNRQEPTSGADRGRGSRPPDKAPALVRPTTNFSNWSEYVADLPPVLLVRATPKIVEGFWTKVGRYAASTQGVSLPPFKRPKSGFSRMRAFCGDTEITPIHPFTLEQRVSANDVIDEGLYVFDPGALQPSCASVKLVLYSEKQPDKPDTLVVDAKVVQQIWQDFAPYRGLKEHLAAPKS